MGSNISEKNKTYDQSKIICAEITRLSQKYNKEYLDCNDLMGILGIGRDNARALMRSEGFPTLSVGSRKVVSVMSFVLWQFGKDNLTYSALRANM